MPLDADAKLQFEEFRQKYSAGPPPFQAMAALATPLVRLILESLPASRERTKAVQYIEDSMIYARVALAREELGQ